MASTKNNCPKCTGLKDIRSEFCRTCSQKIRIHYNLGSAKWHLMAGYLVRWDNTLKRYTRQHVLIMESYLGRKLEPDEIVHHIDHIKSNNKIWNLELMLNNEHHKLYWRIYRREH